MAMACVTKEVQKVEAYPFVEVERGGDFSTPVWLLHS